MWGGILFCGSVLMTCYIIKTCPFVTELHVFGEGAFKILIFGSNCRAYNNNNKNKYKHLAWNTWKFFTSGSMDGSSSTQGCRQRTWTILPSLKKVIWVIGVLRRTVVCHLIVLRLPQFNLPLIVLKPPSTNDITNHHYPQTTLWTDCTFVWPQPTSVQR